MIKEIKLPELGENITSADVVNVLVKAGDKVEKEQVIIEIETDKATIEVPSEFTGTIEEVFVKEGDKAEIGQVLFNVNESGDGETKKDEPKAVQEKVETSSNDLPKKVKEEKTTTSVSGGVAEIKLPELGENIESASVIKVLVSAGSQISKDDIILEIETDKATIEIPSEFSGKVKELFVKEGDTAKIGQTLITVESSSNLKVTETSEQPMIVEQAVPERKEIKKVEQPRVPKPQVNSDAEKQISKHNIVPAAPSVRRFAREIGVQISQVRGTGPGGRISIDDVKTYAKSINEKISKGGLGISSVSSEPLPDFTKWGSVEVEAMSNIRKKTAEHLSYAWNSVPHVTQFDKADITELEKLRKKFGKSVEAHGGKLTVTAILVKIIASALKVFPQFNTSIDMQRHEVIYKKYFNVGIAVDTDRGLLVPVIRNADKKNIIEIAKDLAEISEKARNKKLTLEDMQGGSFTISNLGGIGGTAFTPIVNSPEVAILGVSRGSFEPVFIDGEFQPRMMLPLSLSYDHRIIDGADAARFIKWLSNALENPFLLSLEG